MAEPLVAVISAGRAGNVPKLAPLLEGCDVAWFVPADQAGDYEYAGAEHVIPAGGLCESRNQALDLAFDQGRPCVQISDDLRKIEWTDGEGKLPTTVAQAVRRMLEALESTGLYLAGAAPTANAYFYRKALHTDAFIIGDLVTVLPSAPRFDTALKLKEDYDFTLQHVALYGGAARVNGVLATFTHRTNRGGAVAVRTPDLEDGAIRYLMEKWPGALRPHGRRAHEVSFVKKGVSELATAAR